MLRLLIATAIGYVLGKERKRHDKSGGNRTMSLVCVSACLITILSQKLLGIEGTEFDYARLMAYGISGMGFIGAGVIWKHGRSVEGLTTAATLFLLMPIGYCIGLEFYVEGIYATLLAYLVLESKYWFVKEDSK